MNTLLIFAWAILMFIVMAFLERTIEGPNVWGKKTYGWKYKLNKRFSITEYHFWFWIFLILIFAFPLIINYSTRLLGILISAFMVGFIIEGFAYFIVNPHFSLKKFNKKNVYWYPWIKIKKIQIPLHYILGILIAIASWYFLWR
jgi:hypothetical protein